MKNSINQVNELQINNLYTGAQKSKLIHIIFMIMCILVYTALHFLLVSISNNKDHLFITLDRFEINRVTLSGMIAQGQVIAVILLTLNPIKKSSLIVCILCSLTGTSALINVIKSINMDALPGVAVSLTSIAITIIISNYGRNLNNQIHRVVKYSKIVKKNEEMLHRLAFYDTLTGLPNRRMMMDQIDLLTCAEQPSENNFILVYLDLDDFKKVNDSMGHSVGDSILNQVALRWKEKCHKDDILGRVGGDEFVILIRHSCSNLELKDYLNSLRSALSEPIILERKEFNLSASFGITKFPEDGANAEVLFKNADIALYKVKNLGKNDFQFFNKEMQEEVVRRIQLENGLVTAIRNNELYMVFQPQYVSGSKKLRGYEALVRWRHPEWGVINPSEFIPIAEETGIIIEIGKWIIETVLYKFIEFRAKLNMKAMVAINISVAQLLEPSFVRTVEEILNRTGFDVRYLEFEITESMFISYPDYVITVLNQLKDLGIKIALDDFGTGYASLNYLQILPINILKIDKTFIDKINANSSNKQIVGAIISLSHQLGIKVIAEGVEREDQLSYLVKYKCDYIQGYLLGKPMSEEQINRSKLSATG